MMRSNLKYNLHIILSLLIFICISTALTLLVFSISHLLNGIFHEIHYVFFFPNVSHFIPFLCPVVLRLLLLLQLLIIQELLLIVRVEIKQ